MPQVYEVAVDGTVYVKLAQQSDYIVQHAGVSVADGYIARLVDYFRDLATFPERGHRRPDIISGLHVIGFGRSANIAIVVESTSVYVVGVGGEDYESALRESSTTP